MKHIKNNGWLLLFLAVELVLYGIILNSSGNLLIWSEYLSIVLCFLFALIRFQSLLMITGLAMTLVADFCLVICDPIQQLWGMIFFLAAQCFYGIKLHRQGLHQGLLAARLALSAAAVLAALLVLKENVDALALISVCYYANLIMNLICAFVRLRKNPMLAIGFCFFLLCDTVIGLQVAAGGYLPIREGSLLYRIIFPGFHLSWLFYLPSQVFLAISSRKG